MQKKETKDNKRELRKRGKSRHEYYHGIFKPKHTSNYIMYRKTVILLHNIAFLLYKNNDAYKKNILKDME